MFSLFLNPALFIIPLDNLYVHILFQFNSILCQYYPKCSVFIIPIALVPIVKILVVAAVAVKLILVVLGLLPVVEVESVAVV